MPSWLISILAATSCRNRSGGGTATPAEAAQKSDSSLIFGILTLILAVIALILLQVNSNLKKMSDQKDGIPSPEPVPFYRNKAYIALAAICIIHGGWLLYLPGCAGIGPQQRLSA